MNGVFRDKWGVQGRRQVLRRRGCYKVGFREEIQGESKKNVICGACAKLYLFCASLLYVIFSIFKKKFVFFSTSMAPKNLRTFFLSK